MSSPKRFPLVAKVILFQITFLLIHYIYDWFPGPVTFLIGANSESVFQHMKVVFFSYILLTVLESGLVGAAIPSLTRFVYSRLLGAVLMPLLMVVFYLSAAAYVGEWMSIPLEVLFANLALLAVSTTTFLLEGYFEQLEPSRPLQWALIILFVLAASEIVIFNYRLPWFDVFAIPPGWE